MENTEKKSLFGPLTLAILILTLVFLIYFLVQPKPTYLKVDFYDVGQGDAALISTPAGQHVLIDGGPNDAVISKLDHDVPIYHRTIDAIVLSHPHADHLDGLLSVLKKYEVKDLYITGILHTTPEYLEFLNLAKSKNIKTHQVVAGSTLDFGDGITLANYFPIKNLAGQKIDNLNNSSIVSKLVYGESEVLFTGDLEKEGQSELLATKPDLHADVLKVPHHGSKDSANEKFIDAVSPKYAIISVGKDNKFNHPAPSHLELLKNIKVFRTDQDGDVKFLLTKTSIGVQ